MGRVTRLKAIAPLLSCLLCCLPLWSCSTPSGAVRRTVAQNLALAGGLQSVAFHTASFTLRGFMRMRPEEPELVVYIEGDGHAYHNRTTPSEDPTPSNPVALRLALCDSAPSLLYLGRPCQYTQGEPCPLRFWTLDRYAREVIAAMDQALNQAKQRCGAKRLHLVGYSGGGAVAALLAAQREDIASMTTVAGNLDHEQWTRLHAITPLAGSLNPADYAEQLRSIRQLHFVGEKDTIMPPDVARSYMRKLEPCAAARMVVVPHAGHSDGWPEVWPSLLQTWSGFLHRQGENAPLDAGKTTSAF